MANNQLIEEQINALFSEVQYLIRLLHVTQDMNMKNLILNQLWNKIEQLQFLVRLESGPITQPQPSIQTGPSKPLPTCPAKTLPPVQASPAQQAQPAQQAPSTQQGANLQAITREQLTQFNGLNGKPAYVAVRGTVYDVTNNAAWSAATHFGLTAGQDLTNEFASCHAAEQWILNTLTPVGRLVN